MHSLTRNLPATLALTVAATVVLPLVAGATYLWHERGWLILVDLSTVAAHALCL